MMTKIKRRTAMAAMVAAGLLGGIATSSHAADMTF
ncbi:MAG: C4-dicarboxylate ABC transporter, partial [Alphaproteobacteria bacterium]|nr:C4-dicarboxylate ABC transporter [Alphaproteobacteria bacterium]